MRQPNLRLNAAAAAALAALAFLGFIALPALAATHVDVNLNLGGPGIVWTHAPRMILVPGTQVYWVSDYAGVDVYRQGPWWYCYRDGGWYRSGAYRGPWVSVNLDLIPRPVVYVPERYHHLRHVEVVRERSEWRDYYRHDRGRHVGWERARAEGHGDDRGEHRDHADKQGHGHGGDQGRDHGGDHGRD